MRSADVAKEALRMGCSLFDLIVANAIIVSAANNYEPFAGSVAVKDGLLEYVGERRFSPAEARTYLDAEYDILMPGLFNGHCHAELSVLRGIGDALTLWEQKEVFSAVGWFRGYYTDAERYTARQLTYCEALRAGVTFLNDNMYWSLGADAVRAMAETGIRGALSEDVRPDFSTPDTMIGQEALRRFSADCTAAGIIPILAGPAEEDYSRERLSKIQATLRRQQMRYTCHLAETDWRISIAEKNFGKSPVQILSDYGLLNENLIASHVVHVSQKDIECLADSGASVVNTPLCEMKIADGIAPIALMVRAGIPVSLGTDGALWNNSNDIFREMKCMQLLQTVSHGIRSLTVRDVLDMATVNGARAFGVEDRLGSFVSGMEADMVLVSKKGLHMRPLRLGRYENVTSSLVFSATGQDVRHVFVRGEAVVWDGRVLRMDAAALAERVEACGRRMVEQLEQSGNLQFPGQNK